METLGSPRSTLMNVGLLIQATSAAIAIVMSPRRPCSLISRRNTAMALMKFGLAIFATSTLLVHRFTVMTVAAKRVSGAAAETLFRADFGPLKTDLVRAPSLAILFLLVVTTLGVYKPWGLTRYGQRKQQE